jgi:serine/threonine-protein kinase
MSSNSQPESDERRLLIGLVALQNAFVTRPNLLEALHTWKADRSRDLCEILESQQALSASHRKIVEELVEGCLGETGPENLVWLTGGDPTVDPSVFWGKTTTELTEIVHLGIGPNDFPPEDMADDSKPDTDVASHRYRRIRSLAKGGGGEIWIANDRELNRTVALKELHSQDRGARTRFFKEAEITGKLEHPGIVPVYGLVVGPSGRPCYAMKFIEGQSLDTLIQRCYLPTSPSYGSPAHIHQLNQLLRRFAGACDAVAYAHSRGVLHRDIKPQNIMIGKYGETLVVDWGLAKVRGDIEADPNSVLSPELRLTLSEIADEHTTSKGFTLGTLAYMPPEQAMGNLTALDERSDVYALGATLYKILTGRAPIPSLEEGQMIGRIVTGNYLSVRDHQPKAPKGLVAICQKAMALNPDDRYATTLDLKADIEGYLAQDPIVALSDGWFDRLTRWGRRHRSAAVAGAASLILIAAVSTLAAIVVGGALAAKSAALQKELVTNSKMRETFSRANGTLNAYIELIRKDPKLKENKELAAFRRNLITETMNYSRTFIQQLDSAELLTREAALAYFQLGVLTSEIGDKNEAMQSFRRAIELTKGQNLLPHEQGHLATMYNELGNLQASMGQSVEADASHKIALEIREKLVSGSGELSEYSEGLAGSLISMGNIYAARGQHAEAEKLFDRSRLIREALVKASPGSMTNREGLAGTYNRLGSQFLRAGRLKEALESFGLAITMGEQLLKESPESIAIRKLLGFTYDSLGIAQDQKADQSLAIASYTRAGQLLDEVLASNPESSDVRNQRASNLLHLGAIEVRQGRRKAAQERFERAIKLYQELVVANPQFKEFQIGLATSHFKLADFAIDIGMFDVAEREFKAALPLYEAVLANEPSSDAHLNAIALTHNGLGNIAKRQQQLDAAEAHFREAIKLTGQLVIKNPQMNEYVLTLASILTNEGTVLSVRSQHAEAIKQIGRAGQLLEELYHKLPDRYDIRAGLALTLSRYAMAYRDSGDQIEAIKHFDRAIALQTQTLEALPDHPIYRRQLTAFYRELAEVYRRLNDTERVRTMLDMAKTIKNSSPELKRLDSRMRDVLTGISQPVNAAELLALADRAYDTDYNAAAVKLWSRAFQMEPRLAEDRQKRNRYNAASAAALAGVGTCLDSPLPTEDERARYRSLSLQWLQAELKILHATTDKKQVLERLQYWKDDEDFVGVHQPSELAKLPDDERKAWASLWSEVDSLKAKLESNSK